MQLGLVQTGQDRGDVLVLRFLGGDGFRVRGLPGVVLRVFAVEVVEHVRKIVVFGRGRRTCRCGRRPGPYGPGTQRLGNGQQPRDPFGQGLFRRDVPLERDQPVGDDHPAFLDRGTQRRRRVHDPVAGGGPQERVHRRRGIPGPQRGAAQQVRDHRGAAPAVVAARTHRAGQPVGLGEFRLARGEQRPRIGAQGVGHTRPELVDQPADQADRQIGQDQQLGRGISVPGGGKGIRQPPGPGGGDTRDGRQPGRVDVGGRADPGFGQARRGRPAEPRPQPRRAKGTEHHGRVDGRVDRWHPVPGQVGQCVGGDGLGRHAGSLERPAGMLFHAESGVPPIVTDGDIW